MRASVLTLPVAIEDLSEIPNGEPESYTFEPATIVKSVVSLPATSALLILGRSESSQSPIHAKVVDQLKEAML